MDGDGNEQTALSGADSDATDDTVLVTRTAGNREGSDTGLEPGDMLGRYEIVAPLGSGGMGVVYRARDTDLNRDVAIKLLQPTQDGSQPARVMQQRLLREAQAMAQLSHPNLVTVFDVGKADTQVFVAMEFVDGMTLKEYMRDPTRDWRQRLNAVLDAARGLIEAHAANVVHRDFKPENVFVSKAGRVQVGDFGLARHSAAADTTTSSAELGDDDRVLESLTHAGTVLGTPAYMSPEQHEGKPADARSDQFSLGVTLFEALYGYRPFAGTDTQSIGSAIRAGEVQEPPADTPVPAAVHRAILRSLRVDPERRFPSLHGFVDAVEAAVAGDTPRARPAWLWPVVALGAVAITAGAVVAVRSQRQPPPRRPAAAASHDAAPANLSGRDYSKEGAAIAVEFADVNRLRLNGCYRLAWRKDPLLTRTFNVVASVDQQGKAVSVRIPDKRLSQPLQRCILNVVKQHTFPQPRRSRASLALSLRMTPPLDAGIQRLSPTHYRVMRSALRRFYQQRSLATSGARLVPSVAFGKRVGFKIYVVDRASVYAAVGLRNGDTLMQANDMPLTSEQQIRDAYETLVAADHIRLKIRRRGKPLELHYEVVDAAASKPARPAE